MGNASTTQVFGTPLPIVLHLQNEDPLSGGKPFGRSPINIPEVSIDGYTLYTGAVCWNVTLTIVQDGEELFSQYVPAGTPTVQLPANLEGICELRLDTGNFLLVGEIEL